MTVEPGAGLDFQGTLCTVGFVLQGSDGNRYATTAGHCSKDLPKGSLVYAEDSVTPVGRVVYDEYTDTPFRDSLVLRLLRTARSRGKAEVIDGPHGVFTGLTSSPFTVQHVGRGTGPSQVKDDRKGVALAATDTDIVHADVMVSFNDSGSPLFTADGRAIGWITDIASSSPGDYSTTPPGVAAGWTVMRIGPVLERAGHALHTRLTLVNA